MDTSLLVRERKDELVRMDTSLLWQRIMWLGPGNADEKAAPSVWPWVTVLPSFPTGGSNVRFSELTSIPAVVLGCEWRPVELLRTNDSGSA
jgi:hypothetical protein